MFVTKKEMFVSYGDDRLVIANIASPRSVANISENPSICVSFVDIFKQKGFKLRGSARIVERSDKRFESLLQELHKVGGEAFPVRSIIEIQLDSSEQIVVPSHWLFPETTEHSQIRQAMDAYGVRANACSGYEKDHPVCTSMLTLY